MADAVWGVRDRHGEWQPDGLPRPSPLFSLPPRPKAIPACLFAPGGLLFPFNEFIPGGFGDAGCRRRAGRCLHYRHRRRFTVNCGNDVFPFDRWYGSYHDGSPEMHAAARERRRSGRRAQGESVPS